MNSVELVKEICKKRGIPISKLERDCDFANGYIRRLKEGKFPSDRLQKIASYLNVSVEYLLGVQNNEQHPVYYLNEESAKIAQAVFDRPDLRILFDMSKDAPPEDVQLAIDIMKRMKGTNPNG